MTRNSSRRIVRIVAAFGLAAGLTSAAATDLHGAGATFPAPVYREWATAYRQETGVGMTYDAIGSGAGIERIRRREVDFGASDAPLTPDELAKSGLLQFPAVIGGVVPVVNISGIKPGGLKLDGAVLAQIYLGTIRRWNEPAIAELNPTLKLPDANITVVHRSDPSGSTLLWTDYLARTSPVWREKIGSGLVAAWPTGVGGDGNEGVASYVQRTRFAIGYVEYAYARKHRLSDVSLRNHDGHFVQAGREAFHAAAEAADWSGISTFHQLPSDLPGAASWPITGASFVLLPIDADRSERTFEVMKLFDWALRHGERIAQDLDYEPVPRGVVDQLPVLWRRGVRDRSGEPVWR